MAMTMDSKRTVIVYRDTLLEFCETFIRGQAESLGRFRPLYVCVRRKPDLDLPESRVRLLCPRGIVGKVQRIRFKVLGSNRSQEQTIARESPSLIHAHFGTDACEVMPLARALEIPLVVSLHGYDITFQDHHLPRLYLRRRNVLKTRAARFICVSDFVRKCALAKGFPEEKLVVHYTGIDTDFFRADPSVPRSPIVLFVGRLVSSKGCEYLIRAMACVQQVMPATKLVVIGDGPLRQALEQEAAALLQNFDFLGVQEPAVVRQLMSRSTVFSCPCIVTPAGDEETFGMVFAEAQAMGLPVVSCANGGIPEVVAHEQTGFFVPQRDFQALAARLLLLLQNQSLWKRFSEAGRSRATRMFDIKKQAAILENIYESVLTDWKRGGDGKASHSEAHPSNQIAVEALSSCR
jgi:glycosyltransferase involved in cell wall biosynthesis